MSKYNIRNIELKDFLGMPPTMRWEILDFFKDQHETLMKNNPMGSLENLI